jgi:viologen exporter family transport system permease protein
LRALQPALTPWESLKGYASLFVRSLKASFAYRASTVTALMTATVAYAVPLLVWRQVYAQAPPGLSLSREKMFPYLLLACCVNYSLGMSVEFRISQRIRMGLIATDLLKPVDFQVAQGVQSVSDGLFNGFLGMSVFLCGYLFLGRDVFPAGWEAFLLFLPSYLLAFVIMYGICFLFVQGAFYTYSGYGIVAARIALQQTFSGMSAPLTLYPPLLAALGNWLPFRHTIYTPVCVYMGWVRGEAALRLIGEQALWAMGLFLAGKWVMGKALRQLEVQGG